MQNENAIVIRTIASPIALVLSSLVLSLGATNPALFLFKMGGFAGPSTLITHMGCSSMISPFATAARVSVSILFYPKGGKGIANPN